MNGQRRENELKTRTWDRFEEACREALAAGNEIGLLQHTLRAQHEKVEDAHNTLYVRGHEQ
jgi:hypothetical protein